MFPEARATASLELTPGGAVGNSACAKTISAAAGSVTLSKIGVHLRRFAASDARRARIEQRARVARGCTSFGFHVRFALRPAAPADVDHAGTGTAALVEFVAISHQKRVRLQERLCPLVHPALHVLQEFAQTRTEGIECDAAFCAVFTF